MVADGVHGDSGASHWAHPSRTWYATVLPMIRGRLAFRDRALLTLFVLLGAILARGPTGGTAHAQGPPSAGEDEPPAPVRAPEIRLGTPRFASGEVPRLSSSLAELLPRVARCVVDAGGLEGERGLIEVKFLVRARGRAEGVETPTLRGVSAEAGRCVRLLLRDRYLGAPTDEPVGVAVALQLTVADPSARGGRERRDGASKPRRGPPRARPAEPPRARADPREPEAAPERDRAERSKRIRSSKHRPGQGR